LKVLFGLEHPLYSPLRHITTNIDKNEYLSNTIQISDLEPLRALTNLQTLNCEHNKISDLEPLRALTNLQSLDCWNNQISDLEPLRALTNLQSLDCWNNQISDLEPLRALTNLQSLDCTHNKISWWNRMKFKIAVPNCEVES
jgi:Leucine-rich repeat (LRR) protein